MSTLATNRYGKHRVRLLKLHRDTAQHSVCELEADVLLEGDLDDSYLSDDNQSIVPTDTIKNTVHFLAHEHLGTCRTSFVGVIGNHFLDKYEHISGVQIELRERSWCHMPVDGTAHPHSFTAETNGTSFSRGYFQRDKPPILKAGISDHLIMKTTGSGFEGYNVCDLTTLPPTDDRIFATRMTAEWQYHTTDQFEETEEQFLKVAYRVFATPYSPSVQRTLFQIGEAALEEISTIDEIELKMPNVHFLNLDLSKLGLPDQTSVFLPTDEPHGEIEATIRR